MKTSLHAHPSLSRLYLYVKYLTDEEFDGMSIKELFDIEDHVESCEKCSKVVQELLDYEQKKSKENIEVTFKEMDKRNILERLKYKQGKEKDHIYRIFLEKLILNLDDAVYNTLTISVKSKELSNTMLHRISVNDPKSSFIIDPITTDYRVDYFGSKINQRDHTKVIWNDYNQKISVLITKKGNNKHPLVALIRFDKPLDSDEQIEIEREFSLEEEKFYHYSFESIDKGSYFLFIEPQPIV